MVTQSPWRLVVFYFNKSDPRLLVPKRTGLGWTLNFAHRGSWMVLGSTVLVAGVVAAIVAHSVLVR